jgi:cation diffusion facilitator CzcD-associated flavoprotein CzcO
MSAFERAVYRLLPPTQLAMRAVIYWARESFVLQFRRPRFGRLVERMALKHLREQVPDPELREKLTPRYVMGCQRTLRTNEWYPALTKPNVELVTDAIREVRDRNGRNSTLWPTFTWPFRTRTRRFDDGAYALAARRPEPEPLPAAA